MNVPIIFIDQTKADLIGYQAFYKSGNNRFYETIEEISMGTGADPLVEVKQVGKMKPKYSLYGNVLYQKIKVRRASDNAFIIVDVSTDKGKRELELFCKGTHGYVCRIAQWQ